MPPLEDEEDPFWNIQLANTNEARRPFISEALRSEYQDHALPVGTEVTDTSLAGVLGREREVCVPVTSAILTCTNAHDDDRDKSNNNSSNNNTSSVSGGNSGGNSSGNSSGNSGARGQALVLKLRQVNGDGVMSGVGGDVWCAALLLSAWLLENPEVVRDLDVLELGSGLGLCGITAGYLAKSVTLTDYVDELLVNLRHNIEANHAPRVASTVASEKSIEHRRSRTGPGEGVDDGPTNAPQRRPAQQQGGQQQGARQPDRQQQQEQQQQQQHTPEPEHLQDLQRRDALREEPTAGISAPRRRHRVPDGGAAPPPDTAGRVDAPVQRDIERRRRGDSPARRTYTAVTNHSVVVAGGNGVLPPPPQTLLLPLSRARVRVRKLDWTAYAGDGEARRAPGEAEGGGWWWDDRGPDANRSEGTKAPAGSQLLSGSGSLRCDVAVGSALVYSPHHACVADVLSHLFSEEGGCRAAYVVQLSTRPGFDDFLHRLGACGLRYRLERISTVLPAAILNEIRRSARGAVTGGPVNRATDPAVARDDDGVGDDNGIDCRQDRDNDNNSGGDDMGGERKASGFDEFVLFSVFRPRDIASREEDAKSTR